MYEASARVCVRDLEPESVACLVGGSCHRVARPNKAIEIGRSTEKSLK